MSETYQHSVPKGRQNIQELKELLGEDVVLLACIPETKRPYHRGWTEFDLSKMQDKKHLQALHATPNIGVLLGSNSGGLCAIDLDADELVEPFLEKNPKLRDSLRTKGKRGCQIWFRVEGEFPKTRKFDRNGEKQGEFRADGSQSVIVGIHPETRQPYEHLVKNRPIIIRYDEIDFSSLEDIGSLINEGAAQALKSELTDTQEDAGGTQDHPEHSRPPRITQAVRGERRGITPEQVIRVTIPTKMHRTNTAVFALNRGIRRLQLQGEVFDQKRKDDLFWWWHSECDKAGVLNPDRTATDYFQEFRACGEVKCPLGDGDARECYIRASEHPEPIHPRIKDRAQLCNDSVLVHQAAFCRELQTVKGNEFFLSARKFADFFDLTPTVAHRRLRFLEYLGVIEKIENGKLLGRQASRYRYLSPAPEAPSVDG